MKRVKETEVLTQTKYRIIGKKARTSPKSINSNIHKKQGQ